MNDNLNVDLYVHLRTIGTKVTFTTCVPTAHELEKSDHIHMTSAQPWNSIKVQMIQALHQSGSGTHPWKRQIAIVDLALDQFKYVDATSDDANMDSIDPLLEQNRVTAQVETVYDQVDTPGRRPFVSDERHTKVTAELIAEKFGISKPRGQRTLRVTTQRCARSAILPISRQYRADCMFAVRRLNGKFATDTALGKVKSLRGNIGFPLFLHECGFKVRYPLKKRSMETTLVMR